MLEKITFSWLCNNLIIFKIISKLYSSFTLMQPEGIWSLKYFSLQIKLLIKRDLCLQTLWDVSHWAAPSLCHPAACKAEPSWCTHVHGCSGPGIWPAVQRHLYSGTFVTEWSVMVELPWRPEITRYLLIPFSEAFLVLNAINIWVTSSLPQGMIDCFPLASK